MTKSLDDILGHIQAATGGYAPGTGSNTFVDVRLSTDEWTLARQAIWRDLCRQHKEVEDRELGARVEAWRASGLHDDIKRALLYRAYVEIEEYWRDVDAISGPELDNELARLEVNVPR